jgi:general stress protein 26
MPTGYSYRYLLVLWKGFAVAQSTDSDRQPVTDLISRAEAASLTTATQQGLHVSRTMGRRKAKFHGDLGNFPCEDSAKATQIRANPEGDISFSDTRNLFRTSVAGRAVIVHNRPKAEQIYSSALNAWFPDGLEMSRLTLIKIGAGNPDNGPIHNDAFAS